MASSSNNGGEEEDKQPRAAPSLPTIVTPNNNTDTNETGGSTNSAEAGTLGANAAAASESTVPTSSSSSSQPTQPTVFTPQHLRNQSSLASAAGMLQVPGSVDAAAPAATSTDSTSQERSAPGGGAASPTLSAYSDHSGPASPQHTTRALRENDPQQQQQQQSHQREMSASTQPDSQSQPQASTSAAGAASSTEKESSSHPKGEAERAPIAVKADKEAEKRSHWSRFKAIFTGNTRSARAAAAAKAVEEEKERQKNVDPRPFHFKPYTLGELVDPKSVAKLRDMGGIDALIDGLGTDAERGLDLPIRTAEAAPGGEAPKRLTDVEDQQGSKVAKKPSSVEATIEDRERVFGRNVLPQKKREQSVRRGRTMDASD